MIINCNNCNSSFNLDEKHLKPTGSKVRCSKCKNVFVAYPPAPMEAIEKPAEVTPDLEAEKPLPPDEEQKDFEKQIAEYHRSLLIYSYRQKLLQQKLDTLVVDSEIQDYYQENVNNFILGQDVIKGTFIKVPLSAPRMNELRGWSRSNGVDELDKLEKYCITYAEKYSDFNDTWIFFSSIKTSALHSYASPRSGSASREASMSRRASSSQRSS